MSTPIETQNQKSNQGIHNSLSALRFVSEVIMRARRDEMLDVSEILKQHPELNEFERAILDLAYEDYQRHIELGGPFDKQQFLASYPGHEAAVKELLEFGQFLGDEGILSLDDDEDDGFPQPGEIFLGFDLIEELGRGSFARVFLATDSRLADRFVVVKVCRLGKNEAEILARLQHPQIVRVYTIEEDPDSELTAIPMPFLSRATLHDVVWRNQTRPKPLTLGSEIIATIDRVNGIDARLEPVGADKTSLKLFSKCTFIDAVIQISLQLSEALAYTHHHDYCHCDVKPSNVLLSADGRAMLFDFNLASDTRIDPDDLGGTIPYMAPEQLRLMVDSEVRKSVDSRTDVFAFGVTIYQTLTGQLPFGAIRKSGSKRKIAQQLLQQQEEGPIPVRRLNPSVSSTFARTIERCLSFRPEDRPTSGAALTSLIIKEQAVVRRTKSWLYSRRKMLSGVAVACLAVLFSCLAVLYLRDPIRLGHNAYKQGDFAAAEQYYEEAAAASPDDPNVSFWLGRSRLKQDKRKLAVTAFVAAQNSLPDEKARLARGMIQACRAYCLARELKIQGRALRPGFTSQSDNPELHALYKNSRGLFVIAARDGLDSGITQHNIAVCSYFRFLANSKSPGDQFSTEAFTTLHNAVQSRDDMPFQTFLLLSTLDSRASAYEGRSPNPEFIERALKLAPNSPNVWFHAIRLAGHPLLMSESRDNTELVNKLIEMCRDGSRVGVSRDQLNRLGRTFEPLKAHPQFQSIIEDASPTKGPDTTWLIDPLTKYAEPLELPGTAR